MVYGQVALKSSFLKFCRPNCLVMSLEILSCSIMSYHPYYHLSLLFLLIEGKERDILLIYRACFVVNQRLKSEIYYTFIPLVSSHHLLKNEACYIFIRLVSSPDALKTGDMTPPFGRLVTTGYRPYCSGNPTLMSSATAKEAIK